LNEAVKDNRIFKMIVDEANERGMILKKKKSEY
jgi:hypothetical protein